ncbi:MAG: hypothetical protein A3F40_00175 [Chlamydiae bacterium RIFCSPHIGHO2_12_FULL_27_8]|nr:MAG: hypothetical protein A3F40_00175 [Chlamydiae bacterium RIFCSPHIGHO2_12_FULL_27_8]
MAITRKTLINKASLEYFETRKLLLEKNYNTNKKIIIMSGIIFTASLALIFAHNYSYLCLTPILTDELLILPILSSFTMFLLLLKNKKIIVKIHELKGKTYKRIADYEKFRKRTILNELDPLFLKKLPSYIKFKDKHTQIPPKEQYRLDIGRMDFLAKIKDSDKTFDHLHLEEFFIKHNITSPYYKDILYGFCTQKITIYILESLNENIFNKSQEKYCLGNCTNRPNITFTYNPKDKSFEFEGTLVLPIVLLDNVELKLLSTKIEFNFSVFQQKINEGTFEIKDSTIDINHTFNPID